MANKKEMTYQEQLLTPEWKERRNQILDRDWHVCTKCGSSKNLQVHHIYYVDGKMAWEYPGNALITLCGDCHLLEHNKVPERGQTITIREGMKQFVQRLINSL